MALNGASITNNDGPAINIQSRKKCTVYLTDQTSNTLSDGATYAASSEDQKATFFSEGQVVFTGTGKLNVSSKSKHGICSDDYISVENGIINVTSAAKDAIHTSEYFTMSGGDLTLTPTSDGIDSEGYVEISGGNVTYTNSTEKTKAINSDSIMNISGGIFNLTVNGNQSKGLKAGKDMMLSGGKFSINTSGAAVLAASGLGYEPSYCTAVKCDSSITVSNSTFTIKGTGVANKGFSADKDINITSGTVIITEQGNGAVYTNSSGTADAYTATGLSADKTINILGGIVKIYTTGIASKGISSDGNVFIGDSGRSPIIYVKNTGTKLLVSGTANYTSAIYAEPKNIKSDGILTIANGTIGLNATQQGANTIDSDSLLYVTGGTINDTIAGDQSKGIKSTKTMSLSGGTININASGGATLENYTSTTYDPSYCTAIKSDANVSINGAAITIVHTGGGGKGISAETNITVNSGTINVTTSGAGAKYTNSSSQADAYSAACFSAPDINAVGGKITCSSSGIAGKGFKADTSVTIGNTNTSPTINITTSGAKLLVSGSDYSHPKAIVSDGTVRVENGTVTINSSDDGIHAETAYTQNGGNVTITNSYEGVESFNITLNAGTLTVTASNDGINATAGTVSGGTEQNDGSSLNINGGTLITTCTNCLVLN